MATTGDAESRLRGLYGSFLSSASQSATTSEVWSGLRESAAQSVYGPLSTVLGRDPTSIEVDIAAKEWMRGITIQDVSRYRGIAGRQLSSQRQLSRLGLDEQITQESIFNPPWSSNGSIVGRQTAYRIRWQTQRETESGIETKWMSTTLSGQLTTINDVVGQREAFMTENRYHERGFTSIEGSLSLEVV